MLLLSPPLVSPIMKYSVYLFVIQIITLKGFSLIKEKYFRRFSTRRQSILQAINQEDSCLKSVSLSSAIGKMVKFAGTICIGTTLAFQSPIYNNGIVHADSRLNAPTSAGTRVNSDAESLLRYGLPITNKEIREIQSNVETARMNLKTRRITFAKQDVSNIKSQLDRYQAKLLAAVPPANLESAKNSLERLKADIIPLMTAIEQESAAGSGSLQERKGINLYLITKIVIFKPLSTTRLR